MTLTRRRFLAATGAAAAAALQGHTSAGDCGRIAAEGGVKTLVLSHLIPGDDTELADAVWRAEAAKHFGGEIIVSRDLMVI
jgi:ribonuclease BN (tRNA processing enzyme)